MASFFFSKGTREKYPEMFSNKKTVDRRTCTRTVPMEVLSLGMSRTGTVSMQAALETLGIPTYHPFQIFLNPPDLDMWDAACDAKLFGIGTPFTRTEWDQLLGHVGAVTDSPSNIFAKELVEAYPEAKVVLVERDEDAWYRSFDEVTITSFDMTPMRRRLMLLLNGRNSVTARLGALFRNKIISGSWRSHPTDMKILRANARAVYRDHNALVRRVTPKERLLEFKLEHGWEPLCKFLGKEVPDVPFPHRNESKKMMGKLSFIIAVKLIDGLLRWAAFAAFVVVAFVAWSWSR